MEVHTVDTDPCMHTQLPELPMGQAFRAKELHHRHCGKLVAVVLVDLLLRRFCFVSLLLRTRF